MRRFLLTAMLTATFAVGMAATTTTQALPLPQAATCSGVWVVVDYGSLGGTSTRCATSYSTGTAALRSAGFSPVLDGGMVTRIAGKPSSPDITKAYWSYWHATPSDDGSFGAWSYSKLGAGSYHPTRGNAEGWRYQSLSEGDVAPAIKPPATALSTPSPTPAPTTTKPKPKPSASASRSATAKASSSAKAPSTAKAKATPSASGSATGPATPAASASATPPASPTATPTAAAATDPEVSIEAASESVTPPEPTSGGSPVGAIVAGSAVLVAGAGLGGWWMWKGRRP